MDQSNGPLETQAYEEQLHRARQRWQEGQTTRHTRAEHLKLVRAGDERGDWRQIDDPARISERLRLMGERTAASMVAEAPQLEVDSVLNSVLLERIIGENQLASTTFLEDGADIARAVGRVVIRSATGVGRGFGTGFRISPRLLMTNNHVLGDPAVAAASAVEFDFVREPDGTNREVVRVGLDPDRFFMTDVGLDFTIVALGDLPAGFEPRPWIPLIAESGKAIVGQPVNVIQHPSGDPQQVAFRESEIVDVRPDFLHYSSDTEPGSSGSAVLNDDWQLAALHHAGVPEMDAQQRILTTSGRPWDRTAADAPNINWVANEGVRISSIVAHLQSRLTEGTQEHALAAEAFVAPPASAGSPVSSGGGALNNSPAVDPSALTTPSQPTIEPVGPVRSNVPQATIPGAVASIQVPLTISVSLGAAAPAPAAPPPAAERAVTVAPESPGLDTTLEAGRQPVVVFIHGIGDHQPGYSDRWRRALDPHLLLPRDNYVEVVWDDVFDEAFRSESARAGVAAESIGLRRQLTAEEQRVADEIIQELREVAEIRRDAALEALGSVTTESSLAQEGLIGDWFNSINESIGDFVKYLASGGVRDDVDGRLRQKLDPLLGGSRPIMLVAHSWGAVVAVHTLRRLTRESQPSIAGLFTLGSPLWMPPVRWRLGLDDERYAYRHWTNVDAEGDPIGGPIDGKMAVDRDRKVPSIGDRPHGSYFEPTNDLVLRDLIARMVKILT